MDIPSTSVLYAQTPSSPPTCLPTPAPPVGPPSHGAPGRRWVFVGLPGRCSLLGFSSSGSIGSPDEFSNCEGARSEG